MKPQSYVRSKVQGGGRLALALLIVATVAWSQAPAATSVNAQAPGDDLAYCAPGVQFIGFSDALNKTSFGGFGVVELSAITYDQHNGLYYSLADRAKEVHTHFFTVSIPVGTTAMGTPSVLAVTELTGGGVPYTGYTFDGEGIDVSHNKQLFSPGERFVVTSA